MKKAVKILSLILVLTMILSSVGCGKDTSSEAPETQSQASDTTAAEEPSSQQAAPAGAYEGDEFNNGAVGETACVSSYSELTSQVGIDIMKAGGNAVDAAVATIFAVGVCEPHHSGIGGSGLMTIYLADEDRYTTIEYLETIPANVTASYYNKAQYVKTARAAGVPGQVKGLAYALEKYGTMTLAQVLEPVIKIAREGFVLDSVAAGAIADGYTEFNKEGYEYLFELFTNDGFPYSAGDTYKNEDLANTLQIIADKGADAFYTGEIAEKIVAGMKEAGAAISMEDLANYRCVEREPLTTEYYGNKIYTVSNPSNGGVLLLGALNIMEEADIKQYEQGSLDYWKVFNESIRLSNKDAYTYSGDPDFYDMPLDILVSKEHAKERFALMNMQACLYPVPGSDLPMARKDTKAAAGVDEETLDQGGCTTHIAVVDGSGNVVSSTNTVGYSWGCYYATPGLGFVYNNHLNNVSWTNADSPDYFADAGKKVRSTMTPTIVADADGKPIMAVGSPGSTVIPPVVASVINNVTLYGMNPQEAINMPRAFTIDRDTANGPLTDLTAESGRLDRAMLRQLEVFGYSVIDGINDYAQVCGGVAAIYIDRAAGRLYGAGDPRRDYKAVAY